MIDAKLFPVNPNDQDELVKAWGLAEKHLKKACGASGGEITLESVANNVLEGMAQLWVIFDIAKNKCIAAGVTKIQVDPSGKKAVLIEALGGVHSKAWTHTLEQIEDYARDEGCAEVRMNARRGWAKMLPDYKVTHYVMRLEV